MTLTDLFSFQPVYMGDYFTTIHYNNLTDMLMPRFMTESSILFESAHLNKINIAFKFQPKHPNYKCRGGANRQGICTYTRWTILETFKHLEYDRFSTFHVEKFTFCKAYL